MNNSDGRELNMTMCIVNQNSQNVNNSNLQGFIGTWEAYYTVYSNDNDKNYGHQKLSESVPSLIFDISVQGNKTKIRICQPSGTEGDYYFAEYKKGKLTCVGYSAEKFYKYEIPSFKKLQNGELLYSDGGGVYILKHSSTPMDNVIRKYTLLNPINND